MENKEVLSFVEWLRKEKKLDQATACNRQKNIVLERLEEINRETENASEHEIEEILEEEDYYDKQYSELEDEISQYMNAYLKEIGEEQARKIEIWEIQADLNEETYK